MPLVLKTSCPFLHLWQTAAWLNKDWMLSLCIIILADKGGPFVEAVAVSAPGVGVAATAVTKGERWLVGSYGVFMVLVL
jgi:hypothetical protein